MNDSWLTLITRGIGELRLHTPVIFVLVLLVVFPLLFTYIVQTVFDAAYQNVTTAQKQQIAVVHSSLEAQILAGVSTTSLFRLLTDIPTVTGARLVRVEENNRVIIAATDTSLVGQTDGASILFGTAAATPGNAYIYEFTIEGERFWHAYEQLTINDVNLFVVTEHSFRTVDATMVARQQLVYLGLSAIFIFLLAVAYWLIRQKNWLAAYNDIGQKRDEQVMLTNTIAHELRAPLTAIKGYASLLSESTSIPRKELDHVKKISQSTDRLITLINDFLVVARIQADKLTLSKTQIDIIPLITSITSTFNEQATKKGLSIGVVGVPSALLITDSARFTQIITNLISNAVKYTDTGSITITVDQNRTHTVIRIKDSGHGISAEDQRRMFAPFTRVGTADQSSVTGSGLGMWITKHIVELLGGVIALESIEGVGTVVKVTFKD